MDDIQRILRAMQSPSYSIRNLALNDAIALLQSPSLQTAARGIIQACAHNDLDGDLRQRAKQALQADAPRLGPSSPSERQHMLKVACPNGHLFHLDKRVVCSQAKLIYRSISGLHTIRETCSQCGEEFEIDVSCEGYA